MENKQVKKKNIYIMKNVVILFLLLLVGVYGLVVGMYNHWKVENAIPLKELTAQNGRVGMYVRGEIDSYAVVPNGRNYKGESMMIMATPDYYGYTISVKEDSYIGVLISDKKMKEALDAFEKGRGAGIPFEGELVEYMSVAGEGWLKNVVTEGFSPDKVMKTYTLKQTDFASRKEVIYLGFIGLFAAILYYILMGSVRRNIIVEETIESKEKER